MVYDVLVSISLAAYPLNGEANPLIAITCVLLNWCVPRSFNTCNFIFWKIFLLKCNESSGISGSYLTVN